MKNNADEIDIGFDDKDKLLQDMFDKKEDIIRNVEKIFPNSTKYIREVIEEIIMDKD